MEQDEKISGQAEDQAGEKELTQKELEKVSGGLKMAPAALDPDLFPLIGELAGKGGITGEFDVKGSLGGRVGGTGDF